jgi:hypothetical protein
MNRGFLRIGAFLALGTLAVQAHIRIVNPSNGAGLYWQTPSNVSIVLQADGSADVPGDSDTIALRNAIAAWNEAPLTGATLVENTSPSAQASTNWSSSGIHLVMFDESNDSGWFPGGSGIVAITPLWFVSDGRITDADILYNGSDFQFTTSLEPGAFDIQDVGVHELGHFLGLDHSGHAGASMYPYVDSSVILHRSLSDDDIAGVRSIYPNGPTAALSGSVFDSGANPVQGAYVVAVDTAGRTAGGALTNDSGAFVIRGLDPGDYDAYAAPLDQPVSGANLTGSPTLDTDFEATAYPLSVSVSAGQTLALGSLTVGDDVALDLGRNTDRLPLRAIAGQTVALILRGSQLNPGSTLTCSDPDIAVSATGWFGSQVSFTVTVPAGEASGHADLTVTNSLGARDILPAALEITPPNPAVSSVSPTQVDPDGGDAITITGSNFNPGARVVIGDRIYVDGVSGGCTVVDENTITLTTAATVPGDHDIVVLDASGVEGRLTDGMSVSVAPIVSGLFPTAGSTGGGTYVRISGEDFEPGSRVFLNSVEQSQVNVVSATRIDVITEAVVSGGVVTLEVVNSGGQIASGAFLYTPVADPVPTSVSPNFGPSAGGQLVTISGSGFNNDVEVVFGADELTGTGGVAAPSVTVVDADTLVVTAPPGSGSASVTVLNPTTGQGAVLAGAYVYESPSSSGGCGGSLGGADDPGRWVYASWTLGLLAVCLWRARSARRRIARLA